VSDRLAVLPQYLLPKQALTILAGKLASAEAGSLTTSVIRWFVGRYGVNMDEAVNPDIASYKSFNEFFTRPLKAGARPLAEADFLCPVDGAISQFGPSSATRFSRPRVTATQRRHWSVATANWRRNFRMAPLRRFTSARAITTASTCRAMAA
jgi:hypothetical protein